MLSRLETLSRPAATVVGLLLEDTDLTQARHVLDKLRGGLAGMRCVQTWPVTFSMGALCCTAPLPDIAQLVRLADDLMYRVKHAGKNTI